MPNVRGAIEDIQKGRMVILVDDEDRENEGDLCMAAELVTPQAINFMAVEGRGLICLPLTESQLRRLDLPLMVHDNTSPYETGFTISIDAAKGIKTGQSAKDRAHTILAAANPNARPEEFVRPGHVFPLRARQGGVLVRTGQTEGSVDLARLAGLQPAAVICEIMNDDGTMSRRPELEAFSRKHDLRIVSIAELIDFRLRTESLVRETLRLPVQTLDYGSFQAVVFQNRIDQSEHLALVLGEPKPDQPTLVRVQTPNLPSDVFGLLESHSGLELRAAMNQIREAGCGVFLYLMRQKSSLTELLHRLAPGKNNPKASEPDLESHGKLDFREFGLGAQILRSLGVGKIRLLTNHPRRLVGIEGHGLEIVESVPLQTRATEPPSPA